MVNIKMKTIIAGSRGIKFKEELKDVTSGINALKEVSNDPTFLAALPPEFANSLAAASADINKLADAYGRSASEADTARQQYIKLKLELEDLAKQAVKTQDTNNRRVTPYGQQAGLHQSLTDRNYSNGSGDAKVKLDEAKATLDRLDAKAAETKAAAATLVESYKKSSDTIFRAGIDKLSFGLKIAFAEAGAIAANSYLSIIKK
jgi:predicted  nucleic acid-binding Zn-ribbon protein